jgi:hypothetical protein
MEKTSVHSPVEQGSAAFEDQQTKLAGTLAEGINGLPFENR